MNVACGGHDNVKTNTKEDSLIFPSLIGLQYWKGFQNLDRYHR